MLALTGPPRALAADPAFVGTTKAWSTLSNEAAAKETDAPRPDLPPEPVLRKDYTLPALEIIGFDVLLNLRNRNYAGDDYKSNLTSIRRNLGSQSPNSSNVKV